MKRCAPFWAIPARSLTLALAAAHSVSPVRMVPGAIGAAHLRIDPTYSGGEVSHVIERPGYRMVVNRPVPRRSPLQRIGPFVQVAWTPAASLPAHLSDEVDLDGDGVPDVRVAIDSHNLVVDVTPLGARYRPMHSQGVTSFSALIARVKDSLVVRIPLE